MAVQYLGDTLRIPIINASDDIDGPFGESALERDVKRIVINPFSGNRQTFVPESESTKLRELVRDMYACISNGAGIDCSACPLDGRDECYFDLRMSRLGIEVPL